MVIMALFCIVCYLCRRVRDVAERKCSHQSSEQRVPHIVNIKTSSFIDSPVSCISSNSQNHSQNHSPVQLSLSSHPSDELSHFQYGMKPQLHHFQKHRSHTLHIPHISRNKVHKLSIPRHSHSFTAVTTPVDLNRFAVPDPKNIL